MQISFLEEKNVWIFFGDDGDGDDDGDDDCDDGGDGDDDGDYFSTLVL